MNAVRRIDWSGVVHAYGSAAEMPRWVEAFLRDPQRIDEMDLPNAIVHQGTVYTATPLLVPVLIAIAKSTHARRVDALWLLAFVLDNSGGPLRERHRLAKRCAEQPIPNPFKPGEFLSASPPDPEALRAEDEWVTTMEREIEADLDAWRSALDDPDPDVSAAAALLLAAVRHHEQKDEAHSLARTFASRLDEGSLRERIEWAVKRSEHVF